MHIGYCGSYYGDRRFEFAYWENKLIGTKLPKKVKHNNEKLSGIIEVRFLEDSESLTYTIGQTINANALIIKKIIKQEVGNIFEINGEKVKLLKKEICYI